MRLVIDSINENNGLTLNEIFFLDKCFQLMVNDHPEQQWIFEPFAKTKGLISLLPVGIKKTLVLRKLKPDVLITSVEMHGTFPSKYRQLFFYNQYFEKRRRGKEEPGKNSMLVTTSAALKKKISTSFRLDESRIWNIPSAPADDISLADWSEKLNVKEKYSDGREFFLCFKEIGRDTKWEEVLKAFSIFKKWQQSSFKLIVAGGIEPGFIEEFDERLASYKYRADVKILDPQEEDIHRILPSAFGIVCGDEDYTGVHMLNAFQAEVPVISSPVNVFDETVGGAFLPAMPLADELSRQLINLYRDERLRETLVEKGREVLKNFSWKHTVEIWQKCIEECIK